ncbi:hypothetical protein EX30DRAFT_398974 [Ascodesmis nigricans]|uniref:Uncharacterized protein n=1 Tax=Ascodesmis nigricans TaxID=341454 RepID=A0A4S2MJ17_9PEZI|nr:hypothetical protein EX30DRAFT_398974 [Ascodesmis nigricans]
MDPSTLNSAFHGAPPNLPTPSSPPPYWTETSYTVSPPLPNPLSPPPVDPFTQLLRTFSPHQLLTAVLAGRPPTASDAIPDRHALLIPLLGGWVSGTQLSQIREHIEAAIADETQRQLEQHLTLRNLIPSRRVPQESLFQATYAALSEPVEASGMTMVTAVEPMCAAPGFRPTEALGHRAGNMTSSSSGRVPAPRAVVPASWMVPSQPLVSARRRRGDMGAGPSTTTPVRSVSSGSSASTVSSADSTYTRGGRSNCDPATKSPISASRSTPFLQLLSAYLSSLLNTPVPADTRNISLRACKTLLGEDFGICPAPESRRAKYWFDNGGISQWRLREKQELVEILVAGEIIVYWKGGYIRRRPGVELRLEDGSVVTSRVRVTTPCDEKALREGLAMEVTGWSNDALATAIGQSNMYSWDPFQARKVAVTYREALANLRREERMNARDADGDVEMSEDDEEMMPIDGFDGLGDFRLMAELERCDQNEDVTFDPRMDGEGGQVARGVVYTPVEIEYTLPPGVPPPTNLEEYLAIAPKNEKGEYLPHRPLCYPVSAHVPTFPKSTETLAEAAAFKGDHDKYFPPSPSLITKFPNILPWNPTELAPAKTTPRFLQVPIYPRLHSSAIIIHPGLSIPEVHQLVCAGIITLPQCSVLLPEQIPASPNSEDEDSDSDPPLPPPIPLHLIPTPHPPPPTDPNAAPPYRITHHHPGLVEPVYSHDIQRTMKRISARERTLQKEARRLAMNGNRELQVDEVCSDTVLDNGFELGKVVVAWELEQERAGGKAEGERAARELWEKRQGRGKKSQRGRKPVVKTEEAKDVTVVNKAAAAAVGPAKKKKKKASSATKRKSPYQKPAKKTFPTVTSTAIDPSQYDTCEYSYTYDLPSFQHSPQHSPRLVLPPTPLTPVEVFAAEMQHRLSASSTSHPHSTSTSNDHEAHNLAMLLRRHLDEHTANQHRQQRESQGWAEDAYLEMEGMEGMEGMELEWVVEADGEEDIDGMIDPELFHA